MATMSRPPQNDAKVGALRQLLRSRGLDDADFEIVEDARSGIGQLLGMAGGVLSVRRRSTGEIRVYAAGAGATWLASITTDLDRGYFRGPAAEEGGKKRAAGGGSSLWF
jgi:hypothetical protein